MPIRLQQLVLAAGGSDWRTAAISRDYGRRDLSLPALGFTTIGEISLFDKELFAAAVLLPALLTALSAMLAAEFTGSTIHGYCHIPGL